jgi:hypothetical protein
MSTVKERIFDFFGVVPKPPRDEEPVGTIKEIIQQAVEQVLYEPADRTTYHKIECNIGHRLQGLNDGREIEQWVISEEANNSVIWEMEILVRYRGAYFRCGIFCGRSGDINIDYYENNQ